jgi:putative transposase
MPGAIESRDLWQVLVFAAASRLSVRQACGQLACAPSGPTVLGHLASQCSDLDALEGHLNDLLATLIPKGVGKRGRRVAIDLVALPYHGTVAESHQDEVGRSKAKGGTTHFFTYATAYAVVRGRRYTLAMCRVRAKQTMDHVLRTRLARLVTLGIRMKLLLLDRGFYSVRVIQDLITRELAFIMPAVKRGKKPTTPGGPSGTHALAAEQQSHWAPSTVKSAKEGRVDFDLAVVCHNTRGHRGRHQRAALLYATWGSSLAPCIGCEPRIAVVLGWSRPIGKRIKRASALAVENRPCVCCFWMWRWCCAMSGSGCMPQSWRSPNGGRDNCVRTRCASLACCCG